jgi:hypothetical protein
MVNLSPEEQAEVRLLYDKLAMARRSSSNLSEEEISAQLGYDSPAHLYGYLVNWGLPAWFVYPPGHSGDLLAPPTNEPREQAERKARGTSAAAKRLPPLSEANELFGAMLTYIRHSIRRASRVEAEQIP